MGEAKTALEGYLRIKSEYGLTAADKYLDAIPEGAVDQITTLTAELAKVTEELATAQEHIGQPLRLRVTLTKERDSARAVAETLAVALKHYDCYGGEGDDCGKCGKHPPTCIAHVAHKTLAAYRESR